MSRIHFITATLALAGALTLVPRISAACGGTFCDGGPQVMPVDQTGETIVFWIDDTGAEPYTEAHIQIQYQGDAERFAWIIPVTSVPDVLVGSQALFDNMLVGTVPTYTVNSRTDGDCPNPIGIGCSGEAVPGIDFADSGGGESGGGDTNGGPDILDRGFAGAFEYVTLTGGSVQEIIDWLDQNGYAQDDEAAPILDEYLQEGFVFVAVKLQAGVDIDAIHPLAIRYAGTEPCIPIRLTRIAAVDDMAIRAMFLGESRVAPLNWPHVVINESRLDWPNGAAINYDEIVGLAIDEAGGRAWVTEYAGTSAVVSTGGIFDSLWDSGAFDAMAPENTVNILMQQGLMLCNDTDCTYNHPQVEPLLRKYLPAPMGLSEFEFWSCLMCNVDQIDPVAWGQQPGFVADYAERISTPGQHAVAMLGDSPQLTRLLTLLSPNEMIEDPLFQTADAFPTVDSNIIATQVNDCAGGPSYIEMPDGRIMALTDSGTIPDLDGNPAALRIERYPMTGPAQIETDNAATIDALLKTWNDSQLEGPGPGCTVQRINLEALLAMFAIFGITWLNKRKPAC